MSEPANSHLACARPARSVADAGITTVARRVRRPIADKNAKVAAFRRVYDSYGPRRMFWGSDLSRLHCTYRECVTMFTEEMTWIPGDELEWIMGCGLSEWIGWQ